jgi:hypothetical protein
MELITVLKTDRSLGIDVADKEKGADVTELPMP